MSFAKRLKILMDERGITNADLSKKLGVTRATVKWWVDGKTLQLKYDDAAALASLFNVNVDWLMTGNGPELSADNPNAVTIRKVNLKGLCGEYSHATAPIEIYDESELVDTIQAGAKWFFNNFPHYAPEDVNIVTATGDSMEPLISEGDLVFIDTKSRVCDRDGIYFLYLDGQYFIKRVQRSIGKKLILISENPKYRDIEIESDSQVEFFTIGRVIKSFKTIGY